MKKIFIFVSLLTFLFTVEIQANNYVWIHGLNDDSYCWKVYNEAFTAGIGTKVDYSCRYYTLPQIANSVWYGNYLSNKPNMILIGHSLGGLVARELDATHAGNIKGIITIGTPHQGAPIETQLANGGVRQLAGKVYDKVTKSIKCSIVCRGGILGAPVGAVTWIGATILANSLKEKALDNVMGSMESRNQPCEGDIKPGSTYMNTIASRKVNVPILCFAAQEDRWALARLAYCSDSAHHANLQRDASLNATGTYDQAGYNMMQAAVTTGYVLGSIHAGIAGALIGGGWWNPYMWYLSGLNGVASYNWFSTSYYLENGLDYDHAVLVGDCGYEQRTVCYTKYICDNTALPYEPLGRQNIAAVPDCNINTSSTVTECHNVIVSVPVGNDGIVSTYTQLLDKTKGTNVIWGTSIIKGVNHMEEFNHYKTRAEFDKVINGDGTYPPIFKK